MSKLRKIFSFELILGFGAFFAFLKAINWFNKVRMVFSKCLWVKVGSKWIFWIKNLIVLAVFVAGF
jgi:hypothetical protein